MLLEAMIALVLLGHSPAAAECTLSPGVPDPNAMASYTVGRALLERGDRAGAQAPLETAVRLDPGAPLARYALGQVHMDAGRPAEAAVQFEAARSAFACQARLTGAAKAELLRRLDGEIRALGELIRTLDHDTTLRGSIKWLALNGTPPSTVGDRTLAKAELERQRDEARAWRKQLAKRQASPPEVSVALGTALFQAGDMPGAERAYLAALEADPSLGDAHHNLAVVYLATGRNSEAARELERAERAGVAGAPRLVEELRRRGF